MVILLSCKPTKEIFNDELSLDENSNNLRYDYRNDSLDFKFSYFGRTKFNIHPNKKDLGSSFLPKIWLKLEKIGFKEILYFAKSKDNKFACIGITYTQKNSLEKFIDFKKQQIKKLFKEKVDIRIKDKDKAIVYSFFSKGEPFQVIEYFRQYKNYWCSFIFIEQSLTDEAVLINAHDIVSTFRDSVKQKLYEKGKIGLFSLMSNTFFDTQNNYLRPFYWLERFKKAYPNVKDNEFIEMQALKTFQVFKGAYKESISTPPFAAKMLVNNALIDTINLNEYKPYDAVEYILEKSKGHNLIMINEHHLNSYCRYFGKKILKGLYEQGVRYLAVETLEAGQDSLANYYKVPCNTIGFYTADPQFGNLISEALNIGYNLIAYEDELPCDTATNRVNCREERQANNILKIFKADPSAKVLAYLGHSHIRKNNGEKIEKWLGQRLLEKGYNPLTIEQANMRERDSIKFENTYYRYFENKFSPQNSFVLIGNENKSFVDINNGEAADIQVFHPRTQYVDGHPKWMLNMGDKEYKINLNGKQYENTLLQIYSADERYDTKCRPIPKLNLPMKTKNEFTISLPNGKFYLKVVNYLNEVIFFDIIKNE